MIGKLPLLLAVLAAPALAQGFTDLAEIDRQVTDFARQPAQPVDRRLRLAACPAPLSLNWYGTDRKAVQVRCPAAAGWTLYVALVSAAGASEAAMIQRGDAVTIAVGGEGFAVSQPGEALEAGTRGAWIKVRGLAPKAPVLRGKVVRPGLVAVDLP